MGTEPYQDLPGLPVADRELRKVQDAMKHNAVLDALRSQSLPLHPDGGAAPAVLCRRVLLRMDASLKQDLCAWHDRDRTIRRAAGRCTTP
ncbi:hypothetical protein N8I74_09495 [Chitiniphilus purpureus]|uniref:Uncharacterized protein n=1 Tax=Chitiniphilus purpureus TaxID=2981137 RepID=A0ABY6DS79_9NEIS|nr:hypothetical protein [Chitiniphilus sp. CD1]UXY17221.1 hypothetical protein N8I74_09495 [Chitiniphilus sp. CD1]